MDPLTPHEARHTCASYLIAAGVNDMQLAQYIGHTDSRTTKNIYGLPVPRRPPARRSRSGRLLGWPLPRD